MNENVGRLRIAKQSYKIAIWDYLWNPDQKTNLEKFITPKLNFYVKYTNIGLHLRERKRYLAVFVTCVISKKRTKDIITFIAVKLVDSKTLFCTTFKIMCYIKLLSRVSTNLSLLHLNETFGNKVTNLVKYI